MSSGPVSPSPSAFPGPPHAAAPARAGARAVRAAAYAAMYPEADPRLAPLRANLARRLRPVLGAAGVTYPDAEFGALVLAMARVALHWSTEEVQRRERTPPAGVPAVPAPRA